jgi:ribosome-associated protein
VTDQTNPDSAAGATPESGRTPAAPSAEGEAVTALKKAMIAAEAALEKKAFDLLVLQCAHLSSIADYFLIATGRSDVQVQAIARGIEERLGREGQPHALSIEGFRLGHWVVLDFDDVVVHVFYEPIREFYRLETNWTDATQVPLPEPLRSQAAGLKLHAAV